MKTAVIHRHKIALAAGLSAVHTVPMEKGARIVKVALHKQGLQIFESHLTGETSEKTDRFFAVAGTGVAFPAGSDYVDTFVFDGGSFSLFELPTKGHVEDWTALYPAINEADAEATLPAHVPAE